MAASKSVSVRKAQIPSLCHLCENSSDIQWKCVDCDLLMCSKCKTKVHSKFKAADDHDVISLKDASFDIERKGKTNLQNISCKIHKGEKVCLYCNACRKMACPSCVTEKHKKHDLEDLRKVYNHRVCNLEYLCDEMKANLQFADEEGKRIEDKQYTIHNINMTTKQDIINHKDALIQLVETEARKRLQKLETVGVQQDRANSSTVEDNLRFKEETRSKMSTMEAILNENDIDTIMNANDVLIPAISNTKKSIKDAKTSILKFTPGKIDQEHVSQMFGLLQHAEYEPEIKLDILDSYKSNFGVITNLYSCKNGQILMFDEQLAKSMKMLQHKNGKIQPINETKNVRIFDIVDTEKNGFIVSFMENTTLKRLTPNGKFEDYLDLSPLLPRALTITRSGKLLVSVRDQGDPFPLKRTSQRQLLMLKLDGKLIHEFNLDEQNKRLFSLVMRVTTGIYNDIYLVDRIAHESEGNVVAIGYPNKILWKYHGHDNISSEFPFQPHSIVTTEFGTIVVADKDNNACHVLNLDGTLRNIINTDQLGIRFPVSLTIDMTGVLWIGCSISKGQTTGAMLHVVKFSGF